MMKHMTCECGESEYFDGGISPARCEGCMECDTNFYKEPLAPHVWGKRYDEKTGKPYQICKECRKKNLFLKGVSNPKKIKYIIEVSKKITRCIECLFVSADDDCLLQDADANFEADTFDMLFLGCPLKEVQND